MIVSEEGVRGECNRAWLPANTAAHGPLSTLRTITNRGAWSPENTNIGRVSIEGRQTQANTKQIHKTKTFVDLTVNRRYALREDISSYKQLRNRNKTFLK